MCGGDRVERCMQFDCVLLMTVHAWLGAQDTVTELCTLHSGQTSVTERCTLRAVKSRLCTDQNCAPGMKICFDCQRHSAEAEASMRSISISDASAKSMSTMGNQSMKSMASSDNGESNGYWANSGADDTFCDVNDSANLEAGEHAFYMKQAQQEAIHARQGE